MSYIFVKLMGGIGNQLFQYAAGFLQKTVNSGTLLLCKAENVHEKTDYRDLFSEGVKYTAGIPPCEMLYQDDGFGVWNPEDYKLDIILLYGYFQNYSVLKKVLGTFKTTIIRSLEPYRKFSVVSNSGFIHVRRGDYLKLQQSHHIQPLEYYREALTLLPNINHWYLFSDDIEWCKSQELFRTLNITYVEENTINTLAYMSMITEGAIIANSSFSWWGAFLGVGDKNVIYPKRWFEDKTPDLFPEEWVGI
jgi:hypothetical protein